VVMEGHAAGSPVCVTSLQIRNFRSLREFEADFGKLTSLVGENGTGKTAVIEALFFCLAPHTGTGRFSEQDFNNDDAGAIEIEAELNRPFTASLTDGYAQQRVECGGVRLVVKRREKAGPGKALNDPFTIEHYAVPVAGRYGSEMKWQLKRQTGTAFQFSTRSLSLAAVDLEGYPTVQYFGKMRERQLAGGYNSTLQRVLDELSWRFRKGLGGTEVDLEAAWSTYYSHVLKAVGEKKRKTLIDAFTQKASSLLCDNCGDLELALLRLEEPFSKAFIARRSGLNQIDLGGLGSGVAMLMALALLETIAELDKADLVILIDEPEMHLHPQLQSRVRAHLAQIPHQVIYTTHSPLMIDLGDWRSIRRLDRQSSTHPCRPDLQHDLPQSGQSKTVEEHLDDIGEYRQHITTLLRENNELLFARGVVLVEGPVDKYLIRALAPTWARGLDQLTVICCHGKSKLPHHQLLCRAFGVPYFTVFDQDSDEGRENDRVRRCCLSDFSFEFAPSLEAVLGVDGRQYKSTRAIKAIDDLSGSDKMPDQVRELLERLATFDASLNSADSSSGPQGGGSLESEA